MFKCDYKNNLIIIIIIININLTSKVKHWDILKLISTNRQRHHDFHQLKDWLPLVITGLHPEIRDHRMATQYQETLDEDRAWKMHLVCELDVDNRCQKPKIVQQRTAKDLNEKNRSQSNKIFYFGLYEKPVLKQNSVIIRVLYTREVSKASTMF